MEKKISFWKKLLPLNSDVVEDKNVSEVGRRDFLKTTAILAVFASVAPKLVAEVLENKESMEGDPAKTLNQILVLIRPIENWLQNEKKASDALYQLRSFVAKGYESKQLEKNNQAKQKELELYKNELSDTKMLEDTFVKTQQLVDQFLLEMKETIGQELNYINKGSLLGKEFDEARKKHYIDVLTKARQWRKKFGTVQVISGQWETKAFQQRYEEIRLQEKLLMIIFIERKKNSKFRRQSGKRIIFRRKRERREPNDKNLCKRGVSNLTIRKLKYSKKKNVCCRQLSSLLKRAVFVSRSKHQRKKSIHSFPIE
ncbi:hypothetical protein HC823_00885 [Candidatus Gracilibacteria bacterium]|nr:hypothetical protein [Candidatus Gracilibacteria bacterium]